LHEFKTFNGVDCAFFNILFSPYLSGKCPSSDNDDEASYFANGIGKGRFDPLLELALFSASGFHKVDIEASKGVVRESSEMFIMRLYIDIKSSWKPSSSHSIASNVEK